MLAATGGDISSSIQSQLDAFLNETLKGAQRLAKSNANYIRSFENIVKKGVRPVDIVLPVYNGLQVVKPCLESVLARTTWPYNLIVVDDCSNPVTNRWLTEWTKEHGAKLIVNEKNLGFAATINKGIQAGDGEYVCVLNSDVIVTPKWLTKMAVALEGDPRNQIVNPITNNTAEINVNMQPGFSYLDMNQAFESTSSHLYPEIMPTGFCFMFPRSLLESIGYFDEGYVSYGEETDFWMRAVTHVENGVYNNWRAVLADDTYLFHERGSSFSALGTESHLSMRKSGAERFHQIWPEFREVQSNLNSKKTMASYREDFPEFVLNNKTSKYNIAFVVYSTDYCGGMRFIADIVNEMNERDISARVVQIKRNKKAAVSPLAELRSAPIVFESVEEFLTKFSETVFGSGVVVAATNELAIAVGELCKGNKSLTSLLFAQSDDVAISPTPEVREAIKESFSNVDYTITNSKWLDDKVNKELGHQTLGFVRPGYDNNLFYPDDRKKGDPRFTVLLPLIKTYPFKGYERGVELAKTLFSLAARNKQSIRVLAYGPLSVPECRGIIGLGGLSQSRLATVLATEVDVFCDPSHIHTYGLPALEAMASGAVPVMWDNKGINEYAEHEKNAIIFPNATTPQVVANKIFSMHQNRWTEDDLLEQLKSNLGQINQHRDDAVNSFINTIGDKLEMEVSRKKIAVITPHLRKFGGPTTILHTANELAATGHDVEVYSIYSDVNPKVMELAKVPIRLDWKNIRDYDVLISNSDNPQNPAFVVNKSIKKKVMLKLSHNPRFQNLENAGLSLPWDAIITSTDWLADICKKPDKKAGWGYPPKAATRVGWFHYGHESFNCKPRDRAFNEVNKAAVNIMFLAHHHPSKGTNEAIAALTQLKEKYGDRINVAAVGEWPDFMNIKPPWIQYFLNASRENMASLFKQADMFVLTSHSEGLGRMALEVMSSSCALVMTDTKAEFTRDKDNCLIVPVGNIEAIKNATDTLIQDRSLRISLVESAYETASSLADPTDYIKNINRVIKRL
jgi:GT2 family glycosyltransferase/glycosyltransferase involved in cell wall biosynthesis